MKKSTNKNIQKISETQILFQAQSKTQISTSMITIISSSRISNISKISSKMLLKKRKLSMIASYR